MRIITCKIRWTKTEEKQMVFHLSQRTGKLPWDSNTGLYLNPSGSLTEVPRKSPKLETTAKSSSPLKHSTIMPGLNHLFSKLTWSENLWRTCQVRKSRCSQRGWQIKCTTICSQHIQPTGCKWVKVSLSLTSPRVHSVTVAFSPEVLHVLVQQSVERFYKTSFFG